MAGGRPKQFDREEVLQRAMELFWLRGYEAASLPELLKTMGISRQSLYDTFGNKRELYVSAILHYRATQLSQALALLDRDGSGLENVRDLVRFFEELAADTRCRGCFVANALVEMGPHDPEIAHLLQETLEILREGVERALREAQARGELALTKSPEGLSRALTNAMIGLAVTGRLEVRRSELGEICAGTLGMLD
jgi:TetR/AcrR family transcriptional repressor of nem operon